MAKQKFSIIQSTCIPIQIDNCNTDLIIPARYLASTTRDPQFFGDAFMHDLRYDAEGRPVADFVMNRPEYSEAYRLIKFLQYFETIPDDDLPPTSLLREFLGGSSFKY